ncbi:MAG: hypothetical protein AABX37_01500 [Nanoarchaeota archaeon]
MDAQRMLVLQGGLLYNASLESPRNLLKRKTTFSYDFVGYLDLARIGKTPEEWGIELGLSAYCGEQRVKDMTSGGRMGLENFICTMHGFYAGLIDQAATFAQQSGVPYFGLVVRVTTPHQPVRIGGHPELPVTPRNYGPDMIPLRTPETEWVLHPTVNLYVPRKM